MPEIPSRNVALIRHFWTPMNAKDVARGWTDIPLDDDAFDAAFELGEELKGKIDGIVTDNLLRTLQTAQYVSLGSGIPILEITNFLRTWDVGEYTGKPVDEVDPILEHIAANEPDKEIKGGESFNAFKTRFLIGLIAYLNSCPSQNPPRLAFVCHGRNFAVLNAWKEAGFNDELDVSNEDLGYEDWEPGSVENFTIHSPLLKTAYYPLYH